VRTLTGALAGAAAVSAVLAMGTVPSAAAQAAPAPASPPLSASLLAQSRAAQALQPWPVLREGSNSTWPPVTVRSLQYLLDARGAKLAVDGVFGPKTRAAVLAFQRAMAREVPGFAVDGVVGTQTWLALVTEALSG